MGFTWFVLNAENNLSKQMNASKNRLMQVKVATMLSKEMSSHALNVLHQKMSENAREKKKQTNKKTSCHARNTSYQQEELVSIQFDNLWCEAQILFLFLFLHCCVFTVSLGLSV